MTRPANTKRAALAAPAVTLRTNADGVCGMHGGGGPPRSNVRSQLVNLLCDLYREFEAQQCETSQENE